MWSVFSTNLLRNICLEAINSMSCSHAFIPDKMLELEIDRKRLNYNENLKFMPFGKKFHSYAIWELCHLGSYRSMVIVIFTQQIHHKISSKQNNFSR